MSHKYFTPSNLYEICTHHTLIQSFIYIKEFSYKIFINITYDIINITYYIINITYDIINITYNIINI